MNGPKPLPPRPRNNGGYLESPALMLGAFEIQVLRCPCGGRLRLVAMAMDGARGAGLGTPNPPARHRPAPWTLTLWRDPASSRNTDNRTSLNKDPHLGRRKPDPPPARAPQNAEPTGLGVLSRSAGKAHHDDSLQ